MSHHSHLLADVRDRRGRRKPQPFDRFSKAELWAQLQHAKRQLEVAQLEAQRTAAAAHNYLQGAESADRPRFLHLRDAAYRARDAAETGLAGKP